MLSLASILLVIGFTLNVGSIAATLGQLIVSTVVNMQFRILRLSLE